LVDVVKAVLLDILVDLLLDLVLPPELFFSDLVVVGHAADGPFDVYLSLVVAHLALQESGCDVEVTAVLRIHGLELFEVDSSSLVLVQ